MTIRGSESPPHVHIISSGAGDMLFLSVPNRANKRKLDCKFILVLLLTSNTRSVGICTADLHSARSDVPICVSLHIALGDVLPPYRELLSSDGIEDIQELGLMPIEE
jgi:hypothetical protein